MATLDISGEWLGQWSAAIRAAHQTTVYADRRPGDPATYSGDGDVSIRVVPDTYQTSRDGMDWAGGPAGDVIHISAYDDCYTPQATERHLRAAVQALCDLPSGMGWRHGEVVVSVRSAARPGHRAKIVASWVVAQVVGHGLTLVDAPGVPAGGSAHA
jgi:hypothetical protein